MTIPQEVLTDYYFGVRYPSARMAGIGEISLYRSLHFHRSCDDLGVTVSQDSVLSRRTSCQAVTSVIQVQEY